MDADSQTFTVAKSVILNRESEMDPARPICDSNLRPVA
jgi:hypothetical protein